MTINGLKRGAVLLPLMAPFLLTGCVWKSDYDKLQTQNQQLQQQLSAAQQENAADKQRIARLQGAIAYTVESDLLFPPGGWEVSNAGKQLITRIAQKLAATQEGKITVNGYTDNAPIGPGLARLGVTSNQILSQKRAESVMQYAISQGAKPEGIQAVGHGDADPVAPNDTAAGRAQNRRVEFTLAPSS